MLARDHQLPQVHADGIFDAVRGRVSKFEYQWRHIVHIANVVARVVEVTGGFIDKVAVDLLVFVVTTD
jgi:hypothetical protein